MNAANRPAPDVPDAFLAAFGGSFTSALPGWVMRLLRPCDLPATQALSGQRRRWWRGLFGASVG